MADEPPFNNPGAYEIDENSRNPFVPVLPSKGNDIESEESEIEPNTTELPIVDNAAVRYRERRHVTLFINSVTAQVCVWLVTLGCSLMAMIYMPQHAAIAVLVLLAVSVVNAFIVRRDYIIWHGYILTITDTEIILEQSNSLLFWVRREPKVVMPRSSVRDYKQLKPTVTEQAFFRRRGSVSIQTSSQDDTVFEKLSYIKNIDEFMAALAQ